MAFQAIFDTHYNTYYYWNKATGETTWTCPEGFQAAPPVPTPSVKPQVRKSMDPLAYISDDEEENGISDDSKQHNKAKDESDGDSDHSGDGKTNSVNTKSSDITDRSPLPPENFLETKASKTSEDEEKDHTEDSDNDRDRDPPSDWEGDPDEYWAMVAKSKLLNSEVLDENSKKKRKISASIEPDPLDELLKPKQKKKKTLNYDEVRFRDRCFVTCCD